MSTPATLPPRILWLAFALATVLYAGIILVFSWLSPHTVFAPELQPYGQEIWSVLAAAALIAGVGLIPLRTRIDHTPDLQKKMQLRLVSFSIGEVCALSGLIGFFLLGDMVPGLLLCALGFFYVLTLYPNSEASSSSPRNQPPRDV